MADTAARNASKREEKERQRERNALRERANRRIAEAFCGEERRAAAFTSSESFPSTFQIMREALPGPLPLFPKYRARESVSVRIMRLAAHARISSFCLSLSLSLSTPRMSRMARNSYRFTGEKRRDPRDRITR